MRGAGKCLPVEIEEVILDYCEDEKEVKANRIPRETVLAMLSKGRR